MRNFPTLGKEGESTVEQVGEDQCGGSSENEGVQQKMKLEERPTSTEQAKLQGLAENLKLYSEDYEKSFRCFRQEDDNADF